MIHMGVCTRPCKHGPESIMFVLLDLWVGFGEVSEFCWSKCMHYVLSATVVEVLSGGHKFSILPLEMFLETPLKLKFIAV